MILGVLLDNVLLGSGFDVLESFSLDLLTNTFLRDADLAFPAREVLTDDSFLQVFSGNPQGR